jgi:hypothetical protein
VTCGDRHQPNACRSKYGMDRIAIGQIYLPKFAFILQKSSGVTEWKINGKQKSRVDFKSLTKQDSNPKIIMIRLFCPMLCEWLSA